MIVARKVQSVVVLSAYRRFVCPGTVLVTASTSVARSRMSGCSQGRVGASSSETFCRT